MSVRQLATKWSWPGAFWDKHRWSFLKYILLHKLMSMYSLLLMFILLFRSLRHRLRAFLLTKDGYEVSHSCPSDQQSVHCMLLFDLTLLIFLPQVIFAGYRSDCGNKVCVNQSISQLTYPSICYSSGPYTDFSQEERTGSREQDFPFYTEKKLKQCTWM